MLNKTIKRKLNFNAVDVADGSIVKFNETLSDMELIKALVASTSMPFVFPTMTINDKILMDGGTAWNLDVASAIDRCLEIVDHHSKIIVDIIDVERTSLGIPIWNTTTDYAVNYYFRRKEIKEHYRRMADLLEIKQEFPQV
jgi:hypothetical protein